MAPQPLYVFTAPYRQEAMDRRNLHRPGHVARLMSLWTDGTVQIGGPMLTEDSNPFAPPEEHKAYGSFIMFRAESIEKVREIVEADLFYKEDVWVKEEIRINPILGAGPALQ
ncbi:uncharacterized protein C8Q71DRAFT_179255 [Rhodofomes roseus]|uniref:YCII-related domain-containing protein n=1 Tax=Rhodofomes roseus TaxID=34475 RepID=A0ABQ8KAM4_9APHY|nr:uncharacterized protein C8Q71DRAFT_179255 [Rhodofomes roseus]KAH9833871.1 hypothetical protein C8Q71DRAFT_179255 [Rhodofomes roseus]